MTVASSYAIGTSWQQRAACKGPHSWLFFAPFEGGERKEEKRRRVADAKAICASCPVATECLEYALEIREPHGVWGGKSEIERRAMLEGITAL